MNHESLNCTHDLSGLETKVCICICCHGKKNFHVKGKNYKKGDLNKAGISNNHFLDNV